MINNKVSEKTLVATWQSLRSSIGLWDTASITLIIAGSAFICTAYGVLIANSAYIGNFLTAILSLFLFFGSVGIHYGILRFRYASDNGVRIAMRIEDIIFENDNNLKITHQNMKEKNKIFNFLHNEYPKIWGIGLIVFALLITIWRFCIFF